jgi:hypothetical protein
MKKVNSLFIVLSFLCILLSCAKDQPFGIGEDEKKDKVRINKSELEAGRLVKISNSMNSKIGNFIDKRIQDIQDNRRIDNNGVVSLSVVSTQCTQTSSMSVSNSKFYEIIAVKSGDGKTKGFLWNFYGTTYRSFYQELKYDNQGKVNNFILWSKDNKPFFSTDNAVNISSDGEGPSTDPESGESYLQCVARVFKIAQDACNADPVCNLACSLMPTCEPCMVAAAAATCAMN